MSFGMVSMDWQERINWSRMREYRLARTREAMKPHGLGAMLFMYDENVRYVTSTLTPGWNRLKPGLRYAMLTEGGEPILFEQGDIGIHVEKHSPWLRKENIRHSLFVDQGRRRTRLGDAGRQVHQGPPRGYGGGRRQGQAARRRLHRHQHDPRIRTRWYHLDRRHDADDGGALHEEPGRAGGDAHRRRYRRRACTTNSRSS